MVCFKYHFLFDFMFYGFNILIMYNVIGPWVLLPNSEFIKRKTNTEYTSKVNIYIGNR